MRLGSLGNAGLWRGSGRGAGDISDAAGEAELPEVRRERSFAGRLEIVGGRGPDGVGGVASEHTASMPCHQTLSQYFLPALHLRSTLAPYYFVASGDGSDAALKLMREEAVQTEGITDPNINI